MSFADCFDHDPGLLPIATVRVRLRERLAPMVGEESVPLAQAAGRILAAPLAAPFDIPRFTNVAVDGWAFRHRPSMLEERVSLSIRPGRAAAGAPFGGEVAAGEALRVLTGAVLPAGCDSVALQEEVSVEEDRIRLPRGIRMGVNRRPRGEDMARGEVVLDAGHRLRPQDVGAAALMGMAHLPVRAALRVALFSTGDEIVEPGDPLPEGGLYDANRHILAGLLKRLPVRVTDLGILPDEPARLHDCLSRAAATHEVILTSGGASQGDEDHLSTVLGREGTVRFWRIALKPGRPLGFAELGRTLVMALPGNPVAATLCFAYLARPLLLALAGAPWSEPQGLPLPLDHPVHKRAGRTELLRVRLVRDAHGTRLRRIAEQGSGVLTSLVRADGVVELAHETEALHAGEMVPYLPFAALDLD
ncbi:MAG: molybdopterin molybdotransferase MoeA [Geminicoccaceae bacterium]|nr:molybdopterin molybdotransferase MoeA [Geminicoccaceae bacterium]